MSLLRSFSSFNVVMRKGLLSSTCGGLRHFCNLTQEVDSKNLERKERDPKDRSQPVDVETSIRYLESNAYKKAYENELVWHSYRRNFKGPYPPETRKKCIRNGRISTGSPCPICRDEYLVIHYKNIKLLKQFISPQGGEILPTKQTGVCQQKHKELTIEINKAWNHGLITFDVPHREYNYELYYENFNQEK